MTKGKPNAPLAPAQDVAAVVAKIKVELVAVEVPYVLTQPEGGGYDGSECRRCDLGLLTSEQLRKLRAIRRGYDYSNAKLANGGDVKSMADAVRALIDSIQI